MGSGLSLKNHKNIGLLSNTDLDSLKNHKASKPEFNVWPSSALQHSSDDDPHIHGGNTNFAIFASDRDGTAYSCYRPRSTACDRSVRLSV